MSGLRRRSAVLAVAAVAALVVPIALGVSALSAGSVVGPLVVSGGIPGAAPAGPTAGGPAAGPLQERYAPWVRQVSAATGVPGPALAAYGHAERVISEEQPGCALGWTTLAGIGRVESDHGRFQGRTLGADGRPDEPIVGIALDGGPRVAAIADTDGGTLDADPVWDRAVGPMQFIPGTWARWRSDGDGDGRADPQDLDDAALAAGRYLCASGGDLSAGDSWWAAVLTYNASTEYASTVLAGANRYAGDSRR